MRTNLPDLIKQSTVADDILRYCEHCVFYLATCPTYNLLGDEMNSPRGRIYLIKTMLEQQQANRQTNTDSIRPMFGLSLV